LLRGWRFLSGLFLFFSFRRRFFFSAVFFFLFFCFGFGCSRPACRSALETLLFVGGRLLCFRFCFRGLWRWMFPSALEKLRRVGWRFLSLGLRMRGVSFLGCFGFGGVASAFSSATAEPQNSRGLLLIALLPPEYDDRPITCAGARKFATTRKRTLAAQRNSSVTRDPTRQRNQKSDHDGPAGMRLDRVSICRRRFSSGEGSRSIMPPGSRTNP